MSLIELLLHRASDALHKRDVPTILGEESTPSSIKGFQLAYPSKEDGNDFLLSRTHERDRWYIYGEELLFPSHLKANLEWDRRRTDIKLSSREIGSEGETCLFEIPTADGRTVKVLSKRSDETNWNIFKLMTGDITRFVKITLYPTEFSVIEMEPANFSK